MKRFLAIIFVATHAIAIQGCFAGKVEFKGEHIKTWPLLSVSETETTNRVDSTVDAN